MKKEEEEVKNISKGKTDNIMEEERKNILEEKLIGQDQG